MDESARKSSKALIPACTDYYMSKSHRLPFKLSCSSVDSPFSLIHVDVWGPFTVDNAPFRFYVLFVDDCTRFTWIYPLHFKSEVYEKLLGFKVYAENQFHTSLKILRTDGGTEFVNKRIAALFSSHGIIHQTSCPYTQAHNGVAERKHRHITETTITLLHQSSLPLKFWFDAVATAVFLINRMPSSILSNKSPFQVLFNTLPDFSFFKVFGCQCFPWLKPYTTHKLQPKSVSCVFLGNHPTVKGYRCLDPLNGKIYLSRHVIFNETCFPYATTVSLSSSPSLSLPHLYQFFLAFFYFIYISDSLFFSALSFTFFFPISVTSSFTCVSIVIIFITTVLFILLLLIFLLLLLQLLSMFTLCLPGLRQNLLFVLLLYQIPLIFILNLQLLQLL